MVVLLHIVNIETLQKQKLSMEEIENGYYIRLLGENKEDHVPSYSRKGLKNKFLSEVPHLEFLQPAQRNKPSLLYSATHHDCHFDT